MGLKVGRLMKGRHSVDTRQASQLPDKYHIYIVYVYMKFDLIYIYINEYEINQCSVRSNVV